MGKNFHQEKLMFKLLLLFAIIGVVYPLGLPSRDLGRSSYCRNAVSKNGRCGAAFKNTRCGTNAKVFCSRWGWCGTSALHKSTHQRQSDGRRCTVGKVVKKIVKKITKRGKKVIKRLVKKGRKIGKTIANFFTKLMKKSIKAIKDHKKLLKSKRTFIKKIRLNKKGKKSPKSKKALLRLKKTVSRITRVAKKALLKSRKDLRTHVKVLAKKVKRAVTQKRIAFKLTRKTKYAKKCAIKVTKVKKACHPKKNCLQIDQKNQVRQKMRHQGYQSQKSLPPKNEKSRQSDCHHQQMGQSR